MLASVMLASAQDYSVRPGFVPQKTKQERKDSLAMMSDNHIWMAGEQLTKSAGLNFAAIGCATMAGITYSGVAFDGTPSIVVGSIFATGATIFSIWSYAKKYDAGRELKIAAGKITYTF